MANEKERYSPIVIGVDGSTPVRGNAVGGFLPKTAGNITLTNLVGTVIVDAIPCTPGAYIPLPYLIQNPQGGTGGTFTCAGGASGTLGV
jgi:hypothetical protein